MMQPGCNKEIGKAHVFLARRFIIQRMKELKNKKGFKSWGSLINKEIGGKAELPSWCSKPLHLLKTVIRINFHSESSYTLGEFAFQGNRGLPCIP